jgi:hypothetical protein
MSRKRTEEWVKARRIAGLGKYHPLVTASLVLVGAGMTTAAISSPDGHFAAAAAAAITPFSDSARLAPAPSTGLAAQIATTVQTLSAFVKRSSHPEALASAVRSYLAFQQARPGDVKKPLLYFVDFGLPGNTPRGYVFDMRELSLVDGPFMVAHGRGSAPSGSVVPSTFSNANGSAATSLGLYVAEELYAFSGKAGGRTYTSVGMRMTGVSASYNDKARARGVVAHGAPYVTESGAGRSEGCPAVDQSRARRLLPMLSNGALVFLFAPESEWLAGDPWVTASAG